MSTQVYDARSLEVVAELPRYHDWLMREFLPHLRGAVLELGAGLGMVAARYVDAVDSAVLLEPAGNLYPRLRERFSSRPNVRAVCATLEQARASARAETAVSASSFDAAISVNVLEHIEDDRGVMGGLFEALKPGGALLLFVPALPALFGETDRQLGHVRRYTRRSLKELVTGCGFAIDALHYFDVLGTIPWLLNGRLLGRPFVGSTGAQLYDRWVVPFCERVDGLAPRLLGKNLSLVARKPAR